MVFARSEMRLASPAFPTDGAIPTKYSAYGDNVSPPLDWTDAPEASRSFAVFVHDPDAPLVDPDGTYGFVHWVLYNIPGSVTHLDEGSTGYTVGSNQSGDAAYFGPRPPEGHGVHHYFFGLLALDAEPALSAGLTLWQLLEVVEPNVLGMNRLVGTYTEPRGEQ
jgi:Raf kinase inhibitor-like YbhB/YbcL family protein